MQMYGRKLFNILSNVFTIVGSITIALAPDSTTLIIGRGFQGLSFCALFVATLILGEYCHPKRRGLFVTITLTFLFLGVFTCHFLSLCLSWRQIAWGIVIPASFGVVVTFTWPETPAWLAYKERYDESVIAFEWLRGRNEESRKEIKELINAQRKSKELKKKRWKYNCKNISQYRILKTAFDSIFDTCFDECVRIVISASLSY